MLKCVKLSFLNFKTINLPVEKMKGWLLPILLMCILFTACVKTQGPLEAYKAQAAIDDKIVAQYIAANNLTGVQKVSDTCGVRYIVLDKGVGNDIFTSSTQITVGDTCKLLTTGQVVEETNQFHPSYVMGQVILGWQLAIPNIKRGGRIRLLLPSRYAYGPSVQGNIPQNAVLDFTVQLYDILN